MKGLLIANGDIVFHTNFVLPQSVKTSYPMLHLGASAISSKNEIKSLTLPGKSKFDIPTTIRLDEWCSRFVLRVSATVCVSMKRVLNVE